MTGEQKPGGLEVVAWPVVTDQWAETYCELTGRDPDGQQVTFVDGGTVTTFRDMARREIEAMLCAAPKSAVRTIATAEPAEARIRELERYAALGRACEQHGLAHYDDKGEMLFQPPPDAIREYVLCHDNPRATAAEAKLARAVEALRMARDPLSTAKMWAKRKGGCDGAIDKIDRSLFAIKQTLAALQQEGE